MMNGMAEMACCMPKPKWRRLALYVLYRKRIIFSLLFLNVVFFVAMYFMASAGENDSSRGGAPRALYGGFDAEVAFPDNNGVGDLARHPGKDPVGVIDHFQRNCSQLSRPDASPAEDFRWHRVTDTVYVYSAYFDNRTATDFVLLWGISAGSLGKRSKRYCQVWYHDRTLPVILWADYEIIPETHGLRYAPAMFICRVTRHDPPYAVSMVTSKCDRPSHVLPVHAPSSRRPDVTFTVCVSPLNKRYDDVKLLVEFVELNRILGADKIVFYNHSTGRRLDRYLAHYVSNDLVDVIPWQIPVAVEPDPPDPRVAPEIHYFGQVVALNECLYRYMYRSRYLVYLDLDEFIVPRMHGSWYEMMDHLLNSGSDAARRRPRESTSLAGAYLFRNVFFRIDWPDESDANPADQELGLRTLLKLRREVALWPYYQRTKYILVPSAVLQIGIHFVFEFAQGRISHREVPAAVALLHHYREWSDGSGKALGVVDKHMLRFSKPLRQSARAVHRQVGVIDVDTR